MSNFKTEKLMFYFYFFAAFECKDASFKTEELFSLINNCEALKGKPKIIILDVNKICIVLMFINVFLQCFLTQTCQGKEVNLFNQATEKSIVKNDLTKPDYSDFLIIYSSWKGKTQTF